MQDPFANKSNKSFQREVQMWMAVLMCLLVAFLYLAVKRMVGTEEEIPAHILRAGVAQVTPPIDQNAGVSLSLNRLQLPTAPPVLSGAFSNNTIAGNNTSIPISRAEPKPDRRTFGHRESSNEFLATAVKTTNANAFEPDRKVSIPKPYFVAANEIEPIEIVDKSANETAEAIGRQRAQQLAMMTSGLPKRLNQIQSSVKRATAELPLESAITVSSPPVSLDNAFVPSKLAHAIPTPNRAPVQVEKPVRFENKVSPKRVPAKSLPVQPILEKPGLIKTDLVKTESVEAILVQPIPTPNSAQPVANKSFSIKKTFAIKPLRAKPIVNESNDIKIPERPIEPEPSVSKEHIVQAGDSFFTIAQQQYGDARWFRALRLANQAAVKNADELPAGLPLVIPTTEELAEQFPAYSVPTSTQQPAEVDHRIYVTQAGDTLFDIARRKTGQGSRFSEIIGANQYRLPARIRASDSLPAGVHLVLPESKLQ